VGEYNEDDDGNGFFETLNTPGGMMRDHAGLNGLLASDNNY
jgi:hypothetical protein